MAASIRQLARRIKSGPIPEIRSLVLSVAARWMAAGCTAQANQLLALLRETGDLSSLEILLRGFEIPWLLTGTRPDDWPFVTASAEAIEEDLWDTLFGRRWLDSVMERVRVAKLEDLDSNGMLIRAAIAAYDDTQPRRMASPDRLVEAERLLARFLTWDPPAVGYALFQGLTGAAVLSARMGHTHQAKKHLIEWGKGYMKYPANWEVTYALMDRAVTGILWSGCLGPVWKITPSGCCKDVSAIEAALRDRLSGRQSLAFAKLSWRQLLERLNKAALRHAAASEHGKVTTFLREPAGGGAIRAAQQRLGVSLPPSFRAFLGVSNGFGLYDSSVGVEVLTVEQIGWLREADPGLLNVLEEVWEGIDELAGFLAKLRGSLLIGSSPGASQLLLLVPPEEPSAEWDCLFYANWSPGEHCRKTFRFFIEQELQRLDEE
jgi:hypothetical protein